MFNLPDLHPAIWEFLQCLCDGSPHPVLGTRTQQQDYSLPFKQLRIWCKIHVQQMFYHNRQTPGTLQTLQALPPSATNFHSLYEAVIISTNSKSHWLRCGIDGHLVVQLHVISIPYTPISLPLMYNTSTLSPNTQQSNDQRVGDVIPITQTQPPAHLIPNFVNPESTLQPGASTTFTQDTLGPSMYKDESIHLLDTLFPDKKLFEKRLVPSPSGSMATVLNHLGKLYGKGTKGKHCWLGFPMSCNSDGMAEKTTTMEQKMAVFLNTVINELEAEIEPFKSKLKLKWCVNGSTRPLRGFDANQKPDLLLWWPDSSPSEDLGWRNISVFGDIKSKKSPATIKNHI
ncbi:hypothetical protein BDN67DRAFT_986243 [Paxillus ammoniavirescens]|nr:hypothetical protein BDN67DRAFT_986243 [Paxillus ammoniavirescens]